MERLLDARDHDARHSPREATPTPVPRTLASMLGNHAVARLAQRGVAREAGEHDEDDEATPGGGAAPGAVPADEAEGLTKLDELPEDELPE